MNNRETVLQAIEFAKHAGAEQAEALLQRMHLLTIEVTGAELEKIKQSEDMGIAIRAMVGDRIGLSYASDLSPSSLRRTAQRAVEIAHASDPNPHVGLAASAETFPALDNYDPEMEQRPINDKIDRALAIENAAQGYDARVVLTRQVSYLEREFDQAIANTFGLIAEQRINRCGGMAMVVARQASEQQMGWSGDIKCRYADFDPAGVGVEAAEHAVSMLGATTARTQRADLLLEPKMTGAFLQIISSLVCADNVHKHKSLFAGKLGQRVAAEGFTVYDDGAYTGAPGARAWDDEGTPSQRTPVIVDGILQAYLHSTMTAHQAGTRSTGNAHRPSYKEAPAVMASNFMLFAGASTPEALRAGIQRGLWVKQLMNLHTANPISGEFSFGANGLWIENGQVSGPVRGVTISGSLTEWLINVREIANDLTWQLGANACAPSVVISDVSIAGK